MRERQPETMKFQLQSRLNDKSQQVSVRYSQFEERLRRGENLLTWMGKEFPVYRAFQGEVHSFSSVRLSCEPQLSPIRIIMPIYWVCPGEHLASPNSHPLDGQVGKDRAMRMATAFIARRRGWCPPRHLRRRPTIGLKKTGRDRIAISVWHVGRS